MDNLDAFSTSGISDEIGGILNTPLEDNSSQIGLKKALRTITSSSSRNSEIDNASLEDLIETDNYSTSNNRSFSLRNRFKRNSIDNWILSERATNFTPVAFLPSIDNTKNTSSTKTRKLDPLTGTSSNSENTANISTSLTTSSSIQPKSLLPNIIPIGLNLLSTSDSGTSGDNITNDNTPTIGVDIATGLLVRLFDNQQTIGQSILSNPFQVTTKPLADGVHTITGKALSLLGNLLPSTSTSLQLTIDTLLPQLNLTTDVEDTVLIEGSHLSGIVDGTGTALASLSYHFDNQNKIPIVFNSVTGEFDAELNLAGLESGIHILTLVAVDKAGNTLTTNLEVEININLSTSDIVLKENDDFKVTASQTIEIPDTPSILSFKLADIDFDTTDKDSIKDAFEVALVDESGNSLVHTIGKGRDSFFNLTESQPIALAPGAKFNDRFTLDLTELIPGLVIGGDKISIDLSQITPGTDAKLVFRLVNNDDDTKTEVRLRKVKISPKETTDIPVSTGLPEEGIIADKIDLKKLTDVSSSMTATYGQTSFNEDSKTLYTDLSVKNEGQYLVRGPLLVGVTNISDPTVRLKNPDGVTPDGISYFDYSKLVTDSLHQPGEVTGKRTLQFYNPQSVQFTYDLVFLSQLNSDPEFTTEADIEAIVGKPYVYDADATDPDNDTLTYSLSTGPDGMEIDNETGEITWSPTEENKGTHNVIVKVEDGLGGEATQQYVLSTIDPPPNRPPQFTSTPVVDGNVNTPYTYQATALDVDGDNLTFTKVDGPEGLDIDPETGEVAWMPDATQLGIQDVTLLVEDGFGGKAIQSFQILIQQEPGNHAPIIVSDPMEKAILGVDYTYNVDAIDPDNDTVNYSLTEAPTGMTVAAATGQITWEATALNPGFHNITVQAEDGRGGIDLQSFVVEVIDAPPATIQGGKFHDFDSDGIWDGGGLNSGAGIAPEAQDLTVSPFYSSSYKAFDLGSVPGLPPFYGGLTFKADDPNTLLIGGYANESTGALYTVEVIRGEGNHIIGFKSPATYFASAAYNDGGLAYGPNGVMFYTGWPVNQIGQIKPGSTSTDKVIDLRAFGVTHSPGGLNFVPIFLPGAGQMKLVTYGTRQDPGGEWYTVNLSPDSTGTFNIDSVTYETKIGGGPEGIAYVPPESPLFEVPSVLVSEFREGNVVSYEVDANGDPLPDTRKLLLPGLEGAQGALIDPFTGDLLFSTFRESNRVVTLQGFTTPQPPEPGIADWIIYIDTNRNNRRDEGERFTTTDAKGNYSFTGLAPGTYRIAEEFKPGWKQTAPAESTYDVTVTSSQTVNKIDFGNIENVVLPANSPPEFTSVATKNTRVGKLWRYDATAKDKDNDALTYDLPVKPDGMAVDPSTGAVVWNPTPLQAGIHDVILRVLDGKGGVDLQGFQVTVEPANSAPEIVSTPPDLAFVGITYKYQLSAQDADGDPISFELNDDAPNDMRIDEKGVLTWTPASVGEQSITITASDGKGGETAQTVNLRVVDSGPNSDPVITSIPREKIGLGNTYFYSVEVDDADNDFLTYSLVTAPSGMTVDETGRIVWKPTSSQFGTNNVKIQVSDGRGGEAIQEFTINVVSQQSNQPPVIDSTPELIATVNQQYSYDLKGSDPDNDPLLWSLDSAPQGMSVDPQRGTIRWTPTADQVGEHEVAVRVMDAQGAYVGQIFTLDVKGANIPPTIISAPPTVAAIDKTYKYAVVAQDADNDSLTFSLVRKPDGMSINPDGLIEWKPENNQLGSIEVEILVEDSQGGKVTQNYTIVVKETADNKYPVITSTPVFAASPGEEYQYSVTAEDPDGDALTYQLLEKPDETMTIDSNGVVRWTPTVEGEYSVTVGVVDSFGAGAAQQFTITVNLNDAPTIISNPKLEAVPGQTYRYDVRATDPDGDKVTFTLGDNAPNGMSVDEFGRISWLPDNSDVGTYPISLTATDTKGAAVTQSYNLTVQKDEIAPKVNLFVNKNPVEKGEQVTFIVSASDNFGVESLSLTVDGTPVALDAQGRTTLAINDDVTAVASASDAAGNTSTASSTIDAIDSSNTNAPIVELIPIDEAVTAPIDINGKVLDDNLEFYTLSVAPIEGGEFVKIVESNATAEGILGELDPSVLANGTYILRLEALDDDGNTSIVEEEVDIAGELKLGNFRLSFTDLSIPISGIPISVTRTYDTLTANSKDNFGYGWRLEFRDTNLRTSLRKDEVFEEVGIRTVGFKDNTKVYVTLPGGKRETFTFKPILNPEIEEALRNGAFLPESAWFYNPAFVSSKGVTSTLSVETVQLSRNSDTGEYTVSGTPYNPAEPTFGGNYTLTTKEGIVYKIDGTTGDLQTVTDTNGNKLTYSDAGIKSDTGKEIIFGRDAMGRITTITDPMGKEIKYRYDEFGDLIEVTDRENNTTKFVYNEPERKHFLTEIVDPLGRTGVKNEYDEKGRLKKLFDASNNAVELIHDPDNFVETVKDVFGKATTYEYDERGNVVTEIDPLGKVTKRTYDDDNNTLSETVITPETGTAGWKTEFTYDGDGNKLTEKDPLGHVTRYTYGAFGRLLTDTDPLGNTTTNSYSRSGNLLSSFDAAGNVTSYSYDIRGNLLNFTDANKKVTQFKYDPFGNVESVIDALNHETTYTYDSNGNKKTETKKVTTPSGIQSIVTKWDYDNSGKVKFVTDAEDEVTEYQYDKNGNQIGVIDALLRKTESRYDDKGQLIETIYPDKTPNDNSDNPRTINLYDKGGRKRATIDQDGRGTHYKYDDAGQLIETIYPKVTDTLSGLISAIAPTQTPATIDWTQVLYPDETPTYLATNPRSKTEYYKTGEVKAQIDERGNRTEYRYNAKGEQIETIYPDNTPNTLSDNPRTSSKYDSSGRLTDSIDPQGRVTSYKYDNLSRLTETIYPDNTPNNLSDNPTTKTEYDKLGRKVASTDQNGKVTRYEYDDIGQLTDVVQILDASVEVRTEYGYDEANRLIWIEDANDHKTKYEYDKNGRRIATSLPLGKKSYTTYDEVGNIYTTTDFNGDSISYQYDEQNRLIKKEFSAASGQVPVTFTYTPSGQIDKIIDARGTTTFKYDERNRLISRTDPNGVYLASGNTIEYGYDVAGNRTELRTPDGNVFYTYDSQNRLKTVTSSQGTTTYFYDVVGNLVKTELPNGVVENRDYDELNRLKLVKNSKDEVVISSFDYTLDLVGHRRVVQEQNGRKVEYEYDSLYRLTKETITDAVAGNRIVEYTYDMVGNRLTLNDSVLGITTYTYDDNDRLLTEQLKQNGVVVQTIEYRYDDNGNLISQIKNGVEEVSYTWDKENRLIGVRKANGEVISYQYDSDGIRVSSTVNGVKTEFLVDKNLPYAQVLEERVNNGLVADYVYGLDLISQQRGSEKSFYLVDGLGSTRGLTNASGVVTDRYSYDAFGNLIGSGGNTENNYLFAGEQFDRSLGDYYLRARYYDTDTGRFTRRDSFEGSIFDPVSQHKYIYGNANPVSFIDPTGKFSLLSQTVVTGVLTSLAIEAGRSVFAPLAVQAPQPGGNSSDPLESQRELYDRLTLIAGVSLAGFAGFRLVTKNGTEFLAYLGGEVGGLADDAGRYLSPVGSAVRGQFFPKGAWIARETFQKLEVEAGKAAKGKFISALKKSIEQGTVGPQNQQGIKILAAPVRGYTHELKINGSAARILGKFDENGVLIFDDFIPKGLH